MSEGGREGGREGEREERERKGRGDLIFMTSPRVLYHTICTFGDSQLNMPASPH